MNKFSILFNNMDSYKDLGLSIKSRPNFPAPERNVTSIEIQGRNGTLTQDYGTYKDIEIPIQFNAISKDFYNNFRQVKAWLQKITNNKLVLSDDGDYFYLVNYVKLDKEIERKFKVLGRFTATFVCKPFSYSFDGLNNQNITVATTLINEGTMTAEPILKIYGSGNIDLTVNNSIVHLTNVVDYITIDSVLIDCYKNTALCNSQMNGEFPIFQIGSNGISWTGTVTKIEIIPNWRWI